MIGIRVKVHPEHPERWTDALFKWIDGREGVVVEETFSPVEQRQQYLVDFGSNFQPAVHFQGGSRWWCGKGDLVPCL